MKPNTGGVKQSSKETYKNGPDNRRRRAIVRLEAQLASRSKVTKECGPGETVLLTDKDVARIESELKTLKSRI